MGLGVGSRPDHPLARREYESHGLPFHDTATAVASLAEACTVIRRLWSSAEPFDFHGEHLDLTGAFCSPKPVQPHVPLLIGGRAVATLRIAAEHADVWNIPGRDLADCVRRGATLDRLCMEIGRDPSEITRSMALSVSYDDPTGTRTAIAGALDAGFSHIVLILPAPYPDRVVQWVADELIGPSSP